MTYTASQRAKARPTGVGLTFGAMAPDIHQQLADAGLRIPAVIGPVWPVQKFADSITLCVIHGILSDAEAHRARKRLLKQIARRVKPL